MILETMPEVQKLTTEKKLTLIEELWEDLGISVDEEEFSVSSAQLDQAAAALAEGHKSTPWTELKARLADRSK